MQRLLKHSLRQLQGRPGFLSLRRCSIADKPSPVSKPVSMTIYNNNAISGVELVEVSSLQRYRPEICQCPAPGNRSLDSASSVGEYSSPIKNNY
ncbi:hypothetical protein RRG08_017462 [Elysia crispata]|uniref:Uncharacterized protein n=1 Tax=Elysia crispata TaxID=231223 RepID=A0AAE0YIX5_9GAST|nr:hypothetical protein RRG08_017462 [Elysia crispata]